MDNPKFAETSLFLPLKTLVTTIKYRVKHSYGGLFENYGLSKSEQSLRS